MGMGNRVNRQILFFSVVVPTFNRPEKLLSCLDALVRLDYPKERFEVIVVDDGCRKPLDLLIAPYGEKIQIRLIRQENAGPAAARNNGAWAAKGEYLAFTDDDCLPAENWLKAIAEHFSRSPDRAVGGRTVNVSSDLFSRAGQMLLDYLFSYFNDGPGGRGVFLTSNNLSFPSSRFREMGGFDLRFRYAGGEDRELCDRWIRSGFEMDYRPEVAVRQNQEATFSSFIRRHFNYGRGAYTFHRLRDLRAGAKMKVEPLIFYWDLLRFPFSEGAGIKSVWVSMLLFVSQLANASGFLYQTLRGRGNFDREE